MNCSLIIGGNRENDKNTGKVKIIKFSVCTKHAFKMANNSNSENGM